MLRTLNIGSNHSIDLGIKFRNNYFLGASVIETLRNTTNVIIMNKSCTYFPIRF